MWILPILISIHDLAVAAEERRVGPPRRRRDVPSESRDAAFEHVVFDNKIIACGL